MEHKPARLGEDYERKNCLGENTFMCLWSINKKSSQVLTGEDKKEKKPWNQRFEHKATRSNTLKAELGENFKTIKHFHEITLEEAKAGNTEHREVKG